MLPVSLLSQIILIASIVLLVSPTMFWRYYRKFKASALNDSDTDEFILPETGLLSGIMLHIKNKNSAASQAAVKQPLIKHISKLQVVGDGDQSLYELSGEQCKSHSFYNDGIIQPETRTLYGNKTQRSMFAIEFGRHLQDLDYMVDLSKWSDLKLKITNTFASTQFTASQAAVDIFLLMAEGATPQSNQYLKTWEFSGDKPSAAGQYVNKTLPKRYNYRRIMYQLDPDLSASTNAQTNQPTGDSYTFKFGFKEMKEVLFECRPKDMFRFNARQFGKVHVGQRMTPSTTLYADLVAGYVEHSVSAPIFEGTGADKTVDQFEDGNDRFQKQNFAGESTFVNLRTTGLGIYTTFVVDFDFRKRVEDWISGVEKDPIESEWYGNAADHTFRIVPTVPRAQGEA